LYYKRVKFSFWLSIPQVQDIAQTRVGLSK